MKLQTRTGGTLAALALTGLATAGAHASTPAKPPAAKTTPNKNRGSSCANPWQATYSNGTVTGDTREISLQVVVKGRQIAITWHAQRGYQFCSLALTEGRGELFRSTNPSASYRYTDPTPNHSNGIKTLTATARNATNRRHRTPA